MRHRDYTHTIARRKTGGRRWMAATATLLAIAAVGCDSHSATAPEAQARTVITGRVESTSGPASTGPAPAASRSDDLSGIVVSVEGEARSDVTNAEGAFHVETRAGGGPVRLRFTRGDLVAILEIDGVPAGSWLDIRVRLGLDEASLVDRSSRALVGFEGRPSGISILGHLGTRILEVSVSHPSGSGPVTIVEGDTRIESDGDLFTFEAILGAILGGANVRFEGDAVRQDDGSLVAVRVEAEIDGRDDDGDDDRDDGDGDGDDDHGDDGDDDGGGDDADDHDDDRPMGSMEFEGTVSNGTVSGNAPDRSLRVEVSVAGIAVPLDVEESETRFEADGDITTFGSLVSALSARAQVEIEGHAVFRDDGMLLARTLKAETND